MLAGDFVTHYDGKVLPESRSPEDIPVFNRLVLTTPVGAKVTLKGMRDGQPRQWQLTTTEREPNQAREGELENWGLTVRDFTRMSALEAERPDRKGVQVDSVRAGGPCAESKPALRADDIITRVGNREVSRTEDLRRFTREWTNGLHEPKPVLVTFLRGTEELVTVPRIGPEVRENKPARPAKAWLGVETQVLTRDVAEALDLEGKKGVRVTKVVPTSPAEKAGAKVGDIFLKLDGQVIAASTPADDELFDNLIRQYKVGGDAELQGVRAGKPLKLTAKLAKQPKPATELEEYKDERFEFTARELSARDRLDAKLAETDSGVRIVAVQGAGWAALAGLSSGDLVLTIDGQKVAGVPALRQLMAKLSQAKPRAVVFFIKRGIRTGFLELEPKW
jgi:S1-C subfamily serine protease